jgi:pyridoxal phosphate enzyme (YggS family)
LRYYWRPEELAEKRPFLEEVLGPESGLTWHAIGTVQSRKARLVADQADMFHALDRLKIANKISAQLQENGRHLPVFLEVNLSGEATKSGFNCTNWEKDATQTAGLRKVTQQIQQLPGLTVVGLMTMAPWGASEPALTRQLAAWLQKEAGLASPIQLSMGMTDDFEIAIEEGATHVRVGRAIFGERH